MKRVLTPTINYISMAINAKGFLDVSDSRLLPVDQLYDNLPAGESIYVLYSYQPNPETPSRLIFYLHNSDDAPQSHQTLYFELYEAVVSIIECVVQVKIDLSF